jgi:farnesyl-diphosphate farnesyltransferase
MMEPIDDAKRAREFCDEILPSVSRTFALSIRMLPGSLGGAVRDAYLLCRVADTIEDEPILPAAEKAVLLDALASCFDEPAAAAVLSQQLAGVAGDEAHVRLAAHCDLVFTDFRSLPPAAQAIVKRWVLEMIGGMRKFVLAYPAGIRIQTVEEYKEYCYYVAGTVGYLLTDLWRAYVPGISAARYESLRANARAFAQALQTVNILKDVAGDAGRDNSIYIPEQLLRAHGSEQASILESDRAAQNRAALDALVRLAWDDLEHATAYLLTIPRRAVAIRRSCALPLLFAYATLRDLTRTPDALVRRHTVKISRREVKALMLLSTLGAASNRALRALVERTRARPIELSW